MKKSRFNEAARTTHKKREQAERRIIQDLIQGGLDIAEFLRKPGRITADLSGTSPNDAQEKNQWFETLETLGVITELEKVEDKISFALQRQTIARAVEFVTSRVALKTRNFYKTLEGDGINDVYLIGVTNNIGSINNVKSDWLAHEGERRLLTHWKDRFRVEHNDLTIAKNNISRRAVRRLLTKYKQQAAFVLKPNGTFDFLLLDERGPADSKDKMDKIVKLDWGQYWHGCGRKKGMSIRSILGVQRWAMSIANLPDEVQDKCDEALYETRVSFEEYMKCIVGPEEVDQWGKTFVRLIPVNRGLESELRGAKKIFALSEKEEKDYKEIGMAEGESFVHCVYLGYKYTRIFLDRVCSYRIATPEDRNKKIAVVFYEQKPN